MKDHPIFGDENILRLEEFKAKQARGEELTEEEIQRVRETWDAVHSVIQPFNEAFRRQVLAANLATRGFARMHEALLQMQRDEEDE